MSTAPNDLERTIVHALGTGVRLVQGAVGLATDLALLPVRLALRAVLPAPEPPLPEPAAPPEPAPSRAPRPAARPTTSNGAPPREDLTRGELAARREAEREAEATRESPGPELHVDEPWAGYDRMTAAQVVQRLRDADPAVSAMVRLYEERHKARRTILQRTEP